MVRQFVAKAPLMRVPHPFPSTRTRQYWACVIGVDTTGVVRHNLQSTRADYGALTSANAYDGRLYLGSFRMTAVGCLDLVAPGGAAHP